MGRCSTYACDRPVDELATVTKAPREPGPHRGQDHSGRHRDPSDRPSSSYAPKNPAQRSFATEQNDAGPTDRRTGSVHTIREAEVISLRDLSYALRRGWWMPVLGMLVGAAIAAAIAFTTPAQYSVHSQLFVSTTSPNDILEGNDFSSDRLPSYAQLVVSDGLAMRVAARLGSDIAPEELARKVTATPVSGTALLSVTVTDTDPDRAVRIAETYSSEFAGMVAELLTPRAGSPPPVKVSVVDPPRLPASPSSPKTLTYVALGTAIGLLLGLLAAVIRARFDRSVRRADELAPLVEAPLVGVIPGGSAAEVRPVMENDTSSATADAYRHLAVNVELMDGMETPAVIMITSALPVEERAVTAANLALALAEAGRKTAVVEADATNPRVFRLLDVADGPGTATALSGAARTRLGNGTISVISAGPTPADTGESLITGDVSALLDQLRAAYEFVLVVGPPLLQAADASRLTTAVDGVLLVVSHGGPSAEQVRVAARKIRGAGARHIGVILHGVPRRAATHGDMTYTSPGDGRRGPAI
jgi:Mrp family chromosome partitioning ATPase